MCVDALGSPSLHRQQQIQRITCDDQVVTGFQGAVRRRDLEQMIRDLRFSRRDFTMLVQQRLHGTMRQSDIGCILRIGVATALGQFAPNPELTETRTMFQVDFRRISLGLILQLLALRGVLRGARLGRQSIFLLNRSSHLVQRHVQTPRSVFEILADANQTRGQASIQRIDPLFLFELAQEVL